MATHDLSITVRLAATDALTAPLKKVGAEIRSWASGVAAYNKQLENGTHLVNSLTLAATSVVGVQAL